MEIIVVGLNHEVAPVEVREKLALPEPSLREALISLAQKAGHGDGPLAEGAILSTCNRVELYGLAMDSQEGWNELVGFLGSTCQIPFQDFENYLYLYSGEEAAAHLFSVAAGINSMVIGENEVLGQVREAYRLASAEKAIGPILSRLFRKALRVGKRARTETGISRNASSVSSIAVELAKSIFGDLSTCRVLIIGAGEMSEQALRRLMASDVGEVLVINRTRSKAESLARECGGRVIDFDRIGLALWQADIVISSTAAPDAVIHVQEMRDALYMRRNRPLFIIDIAVPRDVEPEVGKLENVYLYDIDDLEHLVQANIDMRRKEIPKVEAIVAEELREFSAWYQALDVVPTISDLRQHADQIRQAELNKALRRLGSLDQRQQEVVKALAIGLVNKLLHNPTVRLKDHANGRRGYQYAEALRELFGLDAPEGKSGKEV